MGSTLSRSIHRIGGGPTDAPTTARRVSDVAHRAVDLAARTSLGRLLALLATRTRDLAAAEDALGEALSRALTRWAADGVPDNPDAWLIGMAQRLVVDAARHDAVRARAEPELAYAASFGVAADATASLQDRRLELLFVCAHPAIDPLVRTPLMLQAVLGLAAEVIAGAFLAAPSAMAQRLVRAKRKIRDAGIAFEVPDARELGSRLEAVLETIYAAYGTGWDGLDGSDPLRADLTGEALFLGRLVADAMPDEPEARGLLALMLYCDARRAARQAADGTYVPLSEQQVGLWDHDRIREAESMLQSAARRQRPGRFQIEAAIQSAHLGRVFHRAAEPEAIVALYDTLIVYAPTVDALVNRAAAIGIARGATAGLTAADALDPAVVIAYQPWWALRAHLLAQLGRHDDARIARVRAAGMTQDPSVRTFLLREDA